MFQQRQLNDVYQQVEVSIAVGVTGGTITAGSTITRTAACTIGLGTTPAQFAQGDILECIPPAGAGFPSNLIIQAWPTATPGTCVIALLNCGSTNAGFANTANYTIIAKRITSQLI